MSFGLVWNAIFSEIVGIAFCGFFMQENRVFWPYFDFGLPSIFARKIQENSGAGGRASGMALQISPEVQNTLGEVRRDL